MLSLTKHESRPAFSSFPRKRGNVIGNLTGLACPVRAGHDECVEYLSFPCTRMAGIVLALQLTILGGGSMSDEAQPRRLPVWRTVEASYLVFWSNRALAIRLGLIPVLIGLFFEIVLLQLSDSGWKIDQLKLPEALGNVLYGIAAVPAITAWHRLVLLGHKHPDRRLTFSIGRSEWFYLYRLFLLVFLYLLASLVISFLIWLIDAFIATDLSGEHFAALRELAIFCCVGLLVLRLYLVFPAAAISSRMRFSDSSDDIRGNYWRVALALGVVIVPVVVAAIIIGMLVLFFLGYDLSWSQKVAITDIRVAEMAVLPLHFTGLLIGTSIWSWSYRYLVQGEDIVLPSERAAG